MTFARSNHAYTAGILLCFWIMPTIGMEFNTESPETSEKKSSEQKREERRERLKKELANASQNLDESLPNYDAILQEAERVIQNEKINQTVDHCNTALADADKVIKQAESLLAEQLKEKSSEATLAIPLNELNEALDQELANELDQYFVQETPHSNFLGDETKLTNATHTPLPEQTPVEIESLTGQPLFLSDNLGQFIEPDNSNQNQSVPVSPRENNQEIPERPQANAQAQRIDEEFVGQVLRNIMDHKVPMITGGALGAVHYLYENEIFNQAIHVRSPKMREFVHTQLLPTIREALAAHFIQLLIPYLPYLKDKEIRSYGTTTFLASYVTTKVMGITAIYLAKMVTETEHGRKLITQYKRLPKRTKETIEKIAPWFDFIRNLFLARSLASYFEPVNAQ